MWFWNDRVYGTTQKKPILNSDELQAEWELKLPFAIVLIIFDEMNLSIRYCGPRYSYQLHVITISYQAYRIMLTLTIAKL